MANAFDGTFDQPGGLEIGTAIPEYPFEENGDTTTILIVRTYKQTQAAWFADRIAGTFRAGVATDWQFPDAYLLANSIPQETKTGLFLFRRTFGKIPLQQTVYSSQFINKPALTGEFPGIVSGSYVNQPDETVKTWLFYSRKTVTSDSGNPSYSYPTGGTYDLTFGPNTASAIAYNASAGTVQTAINALTLIALRAASVTVSGTYNTGAMQITGSEYALGTMDRSSLTLTGGTIKAGFGYRLQSGSSRAALQIFNAYGAAAGPVLTGTITGGTFTLTFFGQTTGPIAYNASTADVQTEIQLLSSCPDATVSIPTGYTQPLKGDGTQIDFTVTIPYPAFSASGSSLTPSGCSIAVTADTIGTPVDQYRLNGTTLPVRTIYTTEPHGLTAADALIVDVAGAAVLVAAGNFTVPDTNRIQFTAAAVGVYAATGTINYVGKQVSTYSAGTKLCRIKRITDFFLPGITPGIASGDDIPLPTWQGSDPDLLDLIMTGATSCNYEVGELGPWKNSPILSRTITTINPTQL